MVAGYNLFLDITHRKRGLETSVPTENGLNTPSHKA
jgi:hypothetical protein